MASGTAVRRLLSFMVVVAMTAFVAACGGGSSSDTTSTNAKSDLVATTPDASGDVDRVTWGLPYGEPTTLDPILGLDYSPSFVSSQLCETLLKRGENGELEPNLASFEQVDDKTVVLDVRDDVKFWDGTPLTADDVLYTLERSAAPESYVNALFASVTSMEKTGPNQVTVKFDSPDARFLKGLSSFAGSVVQKDFSEEAGKDLGTPKGGIMCTGPFKFDKWTSGQSVELSRNDDYWNDEYRARPAKLEFRFFADSTALAQGLVSGEIDGAYEVPAAVIPRLRDASNGQLIQGPSRQYTDILVRRLDGPLGNPDVRRALAGVMDREGIARVVYNGAATPLYALVEPDSFDPEARDQWEEFYEQRKAELPMTVEEAKKLVEESGYDGTPITLQVLAGDQTQSQLAQVVQQSAKEIGLNVEVLPLQPTEYSDAGLNKNVKAGDMAFSVSWNSTPDPLELIPYQVLKSSPYNYTSYDNPKVRKLLDEARTTLDPVKRNELSIQISEIYDNENLVIPLVEPNQVLFINDRLTGVPSSIEYLFTPSMAKAGAADAQ